MTSFKSALQFLLYLTKCKKQIQNVKMTRGYLLYYVYAQVTHDFIFISAHPMFYSEKKSYSACMIGANADNTRAKILVSLNPDSTDGLYLPINISFLLL